MRWYMVAPNICRASLKRCAIPVHSAPHKTGFSVDSHQCIANPIRGVTATLMANFPCEISMTVVSPNHSRELMVVWYWATMCCQILKLHASKGLYEVLVPLVYAESVSPNPRRKSNTWHGVYGVLLNTSHPSYRLQNWSDIFSCLPIE